MIASVWVVNLLLDIGPKADGTIAPEQVKILKGLARWTQKHTEAIYGTQAGIPGGHIVGKTSLSKNKDVLYLYLDYKTKNGILLSGIKSKINKIEIVGSKAQIHSIKLNETDYLLNLKEPDFDSDVTVIKVSLDGPIELADSKQAALSLAQTCMPRPKKIN
ncbi:alpha-L-fucosidase [Pedobacter suwonensis]|uniref:alpha-L-fucosidase n=1 Tax=Pedobacter suwonensis TaxID=332999 RepID=UPI00367E17C6